MLRLRAVCLALFLAVPACQCFSPVAEFEGDAGVADAGQRSDGGVDAGFNPDGGLECVTAADCNGTPWAPQACIFGSIPSLSCVEQHCVSECLTGLKRTCTYAQTTDCMTCDAQPAVCNADTCPTNAFSGTISTVQCRPGVTPPLTSGMTVGFVPLHGASCEFSVTTDVAGLGQVVRRDGRHFWFLRPLGGWCVGEQLPTNAIRSTVACPDCTFGIEGF